MPHCRAFQSLVAQGRRRGLASPAPLPRPPSPTSAHTQAADKASGVCFSFTRGFPHRCRQFCSVTLLLYPPCPLPISTCTWPFKYNHVHSRGLGGASKPPPAHSRLLHLCPTCSPLQSPGPPTYVSHTRLFPARQSWLPLRPETEPAPPSTSSSALTTTSVYHFFFLTYFVSCTRAQGPCLSCSLGPSVKPGTQQLLHESS